MTIATLAFGVMAALAGQYVPDMGEFLRDGDVRAVGLRRYWEADLPSRTGDEVVSASDLDGIIYLVTRGGDVISVEGQSGVLRWARNIADGRYSVFPPTHFTAADGKPLVLITAGRKAQILESRDGSLVNEFEVSFGSSCAGVADDVYAYFGGSDGKMHSLQWNHEYGPIAIRVWEVLAGGPVQSKPILSGEDLFFGSTGGEVHSCKAISRELNWSFETRGAVFGDLLLSDGSIFVASSDRCVYRVDEISGVLRWRALLPAPLRDSPRISGRELYQLVPEQGLYAVDLDNGDILWQQAEAAEPVARNVDRVYLRSHDNSQVFVVEGRTGQQAGVLDTFGAKLIFGYANGDSIYLVSKSGRLLCLRPMGTTLLGRESDAPPPMKEPTPEGTEEAGEAPAEEEKAPSTSERDILNDPLRSRRSIAPLAGGSRPE
jgi:outer membrane protein assembly factor BamB